MRALHIVQVIWVQVQMVQVRQDGLCLAVSTKQGSTAARQGGASKLSASFAAVASHPQEQQPRESHSGCFKTCTGTGIEAPTTGPSWLCCSRRLDRQDCSHTSWPHGCNTTQDCCAHDQLASMTFDDQWVEPGSSRVQLGLTHQRGRTAASRHAQQMTGMRFGVSTQETAHQQEAHEQDDAGVCQARHIWRGFHVVHPVLDQPVEHLAQLPGSVLDGFEGLRGSVHVTAAHWLLKGKPGLGPKDQLHALDAAQAWMLLVETS